MIRAVASGRKKLDIAKDYAVFPSTLSTILKTKENILKAADQGAFAQRKRLKTSPYEEVEKAVFTWFADTRAKGIPVSGAVLQQKAKDFACILGCDDFKASSGVEANTWVSSHVPDILAKYKPDDVCNADEFGLFFQMLPNRTLYVKGSRCHGGKQSKQRLTVMLCVNMDGSDKRPPLVIGKSMRPRCFKGHPRLPVKYVANSKAWITRSIFGEWLKCFDDDMRRKKRTVCLLLDNCTANHVVGIKVTNIELVYFPANSTSVLQPLDQVIIHSVKCGYRICISWKSTESRTLSYEIAGRV
ncbi:tigger transposable element-derived protein 6-like [Ornithodoros turicata]|uniref:tigger transposable element-derived protein 6-like n=1 Tax=Ornithodoros turicata TaxID=34597 RepID=UPI003139C22B